MLLSEHGLDVYQLLAPDLMHEFELGVWKNTFNHLMRILESLGNNMDAVNEFNNRCVFMQMTCMSNSFSLELCRMRHMPTFGRGRIRHFWQDISSQKKLAARDYEAFLVVRIAR